MPSWITVRTPEGSWIRTHRAPFDAATTQLLVAAARSVRALEGLPEHERRFSIYVVLLELKHVEWGLYVGMTGLTPEERYRNHKAGHKASKWVKRHGVGLLPALTRHLNPLGWERAQAVEVELAKALRVSNLVVKQG